MNFSLAREIYGLTAWFVDAASLPGLLGVVDNVNSLEVPKIKYNTPYLIVKSADTAADTIIIDKPYGNEWFPGQLDNKEDFTGIALIKLNGPITLNGGASSIGMKKLSDLMLKMNQDSRIKAFIVYADSGGGASGAVEVMSDTINLIKKDKPVIGLIQKGGMAASACFGIISACTEIYSESEMNIVGSAGTMIQFAGRKANVEDDNKVKHVRLYATKSKKKNKGFEEALNNDNYTVLVDDLLDPINESFLTLIESNRPVLKGTNFNDGHTVFSKEAIGTFIDGIKSMDEVVESLESSLTPSLTNNSSNNLNTNTMNRAELKSKHPEVYNEIYADGAKAGAAAEQDRSGAWLAHIATDPKAVIEGINSGEAISATQTQQFIVKQASKQQVNNLQEDSPEAIAAAEAAKNGGDDAKTELDAFYAGIDQKLNINQKEA